MLRKRSSLGEARSLREEAHPLVSDFSHQKFPGLEMPEVGGVRVPSSHVGHKRG